MNKTYTLSHNEMLQLVDCKNVLNAFVQNPAPTQKVIETAKEHAESLDNLIWKILEENEV